jgi:aminoglycoside phosphotransferase (APT) family kinase protein
MDRRDPLKAAAIGIDQLLRQATHQTLLHGDAKLANFCWRDAKPGRAPLPGEPPPVAAVDFQYCGWGVGVLDVAYCLGSFPGIDNLAADGPPLLDLYFETLDAGPEVEAEWRNLHCAAVADFERFMAGWAGSGYKRSGYLGAKVGEAIALAKAAP